MKKTLLWSLLLSCSVAMPAIAQVRVVDQSNAPAAPAGPGTTTVSVPIDRNSPIGQTFTPTLSSLNYASFRLSNRFTSTPVTLSASLYSGSGGFTSTNLLATSQTASLPGLAGFTDVDFLFNDLIALTVGSTYSLIVNNISFQQTGTRNDADVLVGGQYLGGVPILGGSAQTASATDFVFSEGILSATGAVPEPASWAMMILGMGAVGSALRRRSKVSTTVKFA